jgi:NADPH-dependent curcumin reductase CurA
MVGGPTLDAALAHLRSGARVVLCGRISQTHAAEPYGVRNLGRLAAVHGRMQGFLVFNYHERYDEARTWLAARRRDGSLRQRLHVLEGLDQRPRDSACCSGARTRASWSCASPRSNRHTGGNDAM